MKPIRRIDFHRQPFSGALRRIEKVGEHPGISVAQAVPHRGIRV
jgi:hypothetical protein